jgi:hypothetical protein
MLPEREQGHITLAEVISNAKEVMLRYGKHVPTLIMEASNNLVVTQVPSMPVTHGERMEFMRFVGQVAAKSGRVDQLQQVLLVTEGWMSLAKEDKLADLPPSQDPGRKEVLIISAIQMTERKKQLKVFEILRDSKEQVIGLEEFLPDEKKKDESVKVPLLDAFVQGFQLAFRTRYN